MLCAAGRKSQPVAHWNLSSKENTQCMRATTFCCRCFLSQVAGFLRRGLAGVFPAWTSKLGEQNLEGFSQGLEGCTAELSVQVVECALPPPDARAFHSRQSSAFSVAYRCEAGLLSTY